MKGRYVEPLGRGEFVGDVDYGEGRYQSEEQFGRRVEGGWSATVEMSQLTGTVVTSLRPMKGQGELSKGLVGDRKNGKGKAPKKEKRQG